ncbi:hypothetical protein MUK42_11987 [Musa troglodytarum]|uniref:Uncharacterized protein n=1 Tax=Musa troglodytarum TaxID=320322 RepID=A0A9E7KFP6_9LILI|nr:hypothetical protein MUK42_11987 [Musa troglodytarum]
MPAGAASHGRCTPCARRSPKISIPRACGRVGAHARPNTRFASTRQWAAIAATADAVGEPWESTDDLRRGFVCVNCGRQTPSLFVQSRLATSEHYKAVAHPYIECEFMDNMANPRAVVDFYSPLDCKREETYVADRPSFLLEARFRS